MARPPYIAIHLSEELDHLLAAEVTYRIAHALPGARVPHVLADALLSAPACAPYAQFPDPVHRIQSLTLTPATSAKLDEMLLFLRGRSTSARAALHYYLDLPISQRKRNLAPAPVPVPDPKA